MGTDVSEVTESFPSLRLIKVHQLMCKELIKMVNSVLNILPEIEAARPRCSSGIEALCLLNNAIAKAKLLLQHCSESSKLYLALTGDSMLSRSKRSRNLLEQSLTQMQSMVPVLLAAKISQVVSDLRNVAFCLDPSEEKAGKVLRNLLHQYGIEGIACQGIRFAALRLGITTQKALLIEKRSIRKLLDEVGENDQGKRKILSFFQILLHKYGKSIVEEQKLASLQHEEPFPLAGSSHRSVKVESRLVGGPEDAKMNMLSVPAIPEEFRCPLSRSLMYDPVIIVSGQTFERMWIQKWFDEGHDTCPKTNKKLLNLSLIPNTGMKDLITKWCIANKVSTSDPSLPVVFQPFETSLSSIASLSSSMNDLSLPVDFSNLSIGSSDARQDSDSSHPTLPKGLNMMSKDTEDPDGFSSNANSCETDMHILFELDSLPWKLRCKVVQDIKISENHKHQTCNSMSCRNLVKTILKFVKDADELHDVEAQKQGCLLLLSFLDNCRSSASYLEEEAYRLLTSFLDTEVVEKALLVLEVLSRHGQCNYNFTKFGTLFCILRILDKEVKGLQEVALRILFNLSANSNIRCIMVASDFIPKLVAFLDDSALASYSIGILENFCYNEEARVFLADTDGCIASIMKLLESDSHDDKEHAVAVLLSLCSQRVQYCQLVMDEGIIPLLVAVSNSGNDKGKAMATELLRLLRDEVKDETESSKTDLESFRDPGSRSTERKSYCRTAGIIRKFSLFSKHSSFATKTKT